VVVSSCRFTRKNLTLSLEGLALSLVSMSPKQGVINHQHDNRSDYGDNHAVEIEAGDAACAHGGEEKAPDDRPDNAEDNVEKEAFTRSVHDLTGDEPRDKPQYHPSEYRHLTPAYVERFNRLTRANVDEIRQHLGNRRSAFERGVTANGWSHARQPNGTLAAANRQFSDGVLGRATLDGVTIEPPLLKGPVMQSQNHLDAIALLKADHRKVEELFAEFEDATGAAKSRRWLRRSAASSAPIP
jgi:hypothetical protein